MRWLAILAIYAYRVFLRPFRRRRCLHEESCSAFGIRTFRERGFRGSSSIIRARIRSCRMPANACFVLDERGQAQLLWGTGAAGHPIPPRAIELLAAQAERAGHAAPAPRISTHHGAER